MSVGLPLADEITAVFARATKLLLTEDTVASALKLITDMATAAIPGAIGAGVSLLDSSGQRRTAAASGDAVQEADALQYELGEGPCIMAWASGESVLVGDLGVDRRWPRWSPAAGALGVSSSISSPLLARGTALGVVKVYANHRDPFGPGAVHLVELFAAQTTLFVVHAQAREAALTMSDRLRDSLAQRDTISMAKGLLMARTGDGDDQAFRQLIALSRQAGKPLAQIAAELLASAKPAGD